jgi:peptidoglycan hydrolase-like protein with peptidoglycan-binding domain
MIKFQILVLGFALTLIGVKAIPADSHHGAGISHDTVKAVQEDLKDKGYYEGKVDGILGPQTRDALRRYQEKEHLAGDGRLTRETWDHLNAGKQSTVDDHFEEAGRAIEQHYGNAGKSIGEGSKDMGKEVKKGEVTEGAKDFGKGVGGFGKEVGKGTAKGAKKVAEGVKDAFDGDKHESTNATAVAHDESVKKAQQALKEQGYYQASIDGVMGPETRSALKQFQEKEGLSTTGHLDSDTRKRLGVN